MFYLGKKVTTAFGKPGTVREILVVGVTVQDGDLLLTEDCKTHQITADPDPDQELVEAVADYLYHIIGTVSSNRGRQIAPGLIKFILNGGKSVK